MKPKKMPKYGDARVVKHYTATGEVEYVVSSFTKEIRTVTGTRYEWKEECISKKKKHAKKMADEINFKYTFNIDGSEDTIVYYKESK